ncbi:MAG: XcbB/CpsF family capsular polysaccharide biosynthesis protein [Microgenomates group bacterium]
MIRPEKQKIRKAIFKARSYYAAAKIHIGDVMEKANTNSSIFIDATESSELLESRILEMSDLNFVHVDHSAYEIQHDSLITLTRKMPEFKPLMLMLANHGFHLYVVRDKISSFVRHRRIRTLWQNVVAGNIKCDKNNVFYTIQGAKEKRHPRLLVVFSSIAKVMYTPGLYRHFEQNFQTIEKYISPNTNILRIVDLGGVLGSFYLNSNSLPMNEVNIKSLIELTADGLGVPHSEIVVYGTSKGGTAATYHGLMWGYKVVAVDPILSDDHYIQKFNDSHFTIGTFPVTKQEKFATLVDNIHPNSSMTLICSDRSPQYDVINNTLINKFSDRFLFLNSKNMLIKDHPDVGPQTVHHALAQINTKLSGLPAAAGLFDVF